MDLQKIDAEPHPYASINNANEVKDNSHYMELTEKRAPDQQYATLSVYEWLFHLRRIEFPEDGQVLKIIFIHSLFTRFILQIRSIRVRCFMRFSIIFIENITSTYDYLYFFLILLLKKMVLFSLLTLSEFCSNAKIHTCYYLHVVATLFFIRTIL